SLHRAIQIAISPEGNANVQLSAEALRQAQTRSDQARGALVPDVESSLNYRNQKVNLAAFGGAEAIHVPIPGFTIPNEVGPFQPMDARLTGSQNVFDFSMIRRFQAARVGVKAARSDVDNTGENVAAQVARAYLAAQKAQADVESADANVKLSAALVVLAE